MSATQARTCSICDEDYDYGVKHKFCSRDCWLKSKGESVIRQIETDHTRCSSCFAKRKEIDKPTDSFLQRIGFSNGFHSKQAIVGFEYYTPNIHKDHGFIYCQCGNIDHSAQINELRDIHTKDVLVNLWELLIDYYEKGQFGDAKPEKEVYFETLKDSELDFALAIGKSIYKE